MTRTATPTVNEAATAPPEVPPTPEPNYYSGFYPMHLGLMAVADNIFPIAWWTPVSKAPFRFVAAVDRKNFSLGLLRERREAVLHFLPYSERERVVRAGYLSGRKRDKARRLGFRFLPAVAVASTGVVDGALAAFELRVVAEVGGDADPSPGDHAVFLFDVVHVHRGTRPALAEPILFLGYRDFASLGERSRFRP